MEERLLFKNILQQIFDSPSTAFKRNGETTVLHKISYLTNFRRALSLEIFAV